MYEINNVNKRAMMIRHFVSYFVIALVIVGLAIVIVFAANGYDIDRQTGQIIQNGIVVVDSQPSGARVFIDGQEDGKTSPANISLPQGSYDIRLEQAGYQAWSSQIDVLGSSVSELVYARLVPDAIETSVLERFENVNFLDINPASNQLAVSFDSNIRSISLFNLSQADPVPRPFAIPAELFSDPEAEEVSGSVELAAWTPNGRYMLLWFTHDDVRDLLLLDLVDRGRSANVSRDSERTYDDVLLAGDEVFLRRGTNLYGLSLEQASVSERLSTRLDTIFDGGAAITLTNQGSVIYQPDNLTTPLIDLAIAPTDVAIDRYLGQTTLVTRTGRNVTIYQNYVAGVNQEVVADKVLKVEQADSTAADISFSPSGRFVAIAEPTQTAVYDLDTRLSFSVPHGVDEKLTWLDDYRLSYESSGQLFIVDFTGNNQYQIASFDVDQPIAIDENTQRLYSFTTTASGALRLRQSQL